MTKHRWTWIPGPNISLAACGDSKSSELSTVLANHQASSRAHIAPHPRHPHAMGHNNEHVIISEGHMEQQQQPPQLIQDGPIESHLDILTRSHDKLGWRYDSSPARQRPAAGVQAAQSTEEMISAMYKRLGVEVDNKSRSQTGTHHHSAASIDYHSHGVQTGLRQLRQRLPVYTPVPVPLGVPRKQAHTDGSLNKSTKQASDMSATCHAPTKKKQGTQASSIAYSADNKTATKAKKSKKTGKAKTVKRGKQTAMTAAADVSLHLPRPPLPELPTTKFEWIQQMEEKRVREEKRLLAAKQVDVGCDQDQEWKLRTGVSLQECGSDQECVHQDASQRAIVEPAQSHGNDVSFGQVSCTGNTSGMLACEPSFQDMGKSLQQDNSQISNRATSGKTASCQVSRTVPVLREQATQTESLERAEGKAGAATTHTIPPAEVKDHTLHVIPTTLTMPSQTGAVFSQIAIQTSHTEQQLVSGPLDSMARIGQSAGVCQHHQCPCQCNAVATAVQRNACLQSPDSHLQELEQLVEDQHMQLLKAGMLPSITTGAGLVTHKHEQREKPPPRQQSTAYRPEQLATTAPSSMLQQQRLIQMPQGMQNVAEISGSRHADVTTKQSFKGTHTHGVSSPSACRSVPMASQVSAPAEPSLSQQAISLEGLQHPGFDEKVATLGKPGRVSLADELRALGVHLDEGLAELLAVSPACSTPGSPAGSSNTSETSWSWNNELKKLGIV